MSHLVGLFSANLLPILAIAAIGAVLARTFQLEARPLSLVTFHVFSPALVFRLISESTLDGDEALRMVVLAATSILIPGVLAAAYARLAHLPRRRAHPRLPPRRRPRQRRRRPM